MTAPSSETEKAPRSKASVPQTVIRLDKSRLYSTVHGDCPPGDPHAGVHYYQDGLPFDGTGLLVTSDILYDDKMKATVQRKLKRKAKAAEAEPDLDEDDDESGNPARSDVNLEEWLKGTENFRFAQVREAIRTRYATNINTAEEAVRFLVRDDDVRLIPADQVAGKFQAALKG